MTTRLAPLAALMLLPLAAPASADGTFLQFDLSETASDVVISVVRGRWTLGATLSDYEDGRAAGASLTYSFPVEGLGTFKLGPSLGRTTGEDADGEIDLGAKASFERYQPTSFGHLYVLAEINSIDSAWFTTLQSGFSGGYGIEVSAGGSDAYDATTLALTKRIGDGPISLRAGYRFVTEEVFLGVSVNTF